MLMLPRVQAVKAHPNYQLELTFTNGETGVYDCRPLLKFGVFQELQDESYFRQAHIVNGTVAWPTAGKSYARARARLRRPASAIAANATSPRVDGSGVCWALIEAEASNWLP